MSSPNGQMAKWPNVFTSTHADAYAYMHACALAFNIYVIARWKTCIDQSTVSSYATSDQFISNSVYFKSAHNFRMYDVYTDGWDMIWINVPSVPSVSSRRHALHFDSATRMPITGYAKQSLVRGDTNIVVYTPYIAELVVDHTKLRVLRSTSTYNTNRGR